MPYSPAAEKAQALEDRRRAERLSGSVGLAVRVLVVYSLGGGSEGEPAHPVNVLIACLYVVEKMFDMWAQDAQAVIDDPPRFDFDRPPRVRLRAFYPYVFGVSPLERWATVTADRLNHSAAHSRALVAARERAWGASERDQPHLEERRLADATEHGRFAGELMLSAAGGMDEFATLVDEDPVHGATARIELVREARTLRVLDVVGKPSIDSYLPSESLALLYRVGIRVQHLRRGDRLPRGDTEDPLADATQSYRAAADALRSHGTMLLQE